MNAGEVRYHTATGRWVLLATVLGSGLVTLDATVVNVALPAIGTDLDADFASLQWTVNAYTLTQAGLLLLGGALGDRHGHRRVFVLGVLWFAVASVLCGAAPNASWLIAARALQGVGAALLTPASLAIIEATIRPDDRSAAIGAWSGLGGVMTAIGPLVGGYLTAAVTWRLIFLINLPFTGLAVWAAVRHVPGSRETHRAARHPVLPLALFRSRQFTGANIVTFVIYGALGGTLFLLPIQLQRVVGLPALESGMALIPMTVLMLILSPSAGRLAYRVGPRPPTATGSA